jgi:hypothetical protein
MLAAARIQHPRGHAATIRLVLRRAGLSCSSIRHSSICHSVIAIWNAVSCRAWAAAVSSGTVVIDQLTRAYRLKPIRDLAVPS